MRIIPALDILNGKCVRLTEGNYEDVTVYNQDPVSVAKELEEAGFEYLHIVDLDGARSAGLVNDQLVERIAKETNLHIDFGGGIKTEKDLERILACGVKQVTIGSLAAKNPELVTEWLKAYGSETIILGADCLNGKIAVSGWMEETNWSIEDFIAFYLPAGLKYLICTDISRDGTLSGPASVWYEQIMKAFPTINLIASGGVSCNEDLIELRKLNCYGAIVGKALYEGKISIENLLKTC
jgi:phosphoribosylformimino-5-aminoimidazole carboxamide ribotide isomerase